MTSFSIKTADIKDLIEISLNAGKAIMDIYESDTEIRIKDDLSPLTKADLVSNEIICKSLLKIYPKIPIISEESSKIDYKKRSNWLNYWLVDPLDGTKEFINRNGEFTTNIAMIHKNRPIFGIIHAPERNETYWGDANNGSFFLEGDSDSNEKRIKVSKKGNTKLRKDLFEKYKIKSFTTTDKTAVTEVGVGMSARHRAVFGRHPVAATAGNCATQG